MTTLQVMVIVIHIIECIIIIVHSTYIEWGHSLVTSIKQTQLRLNQAKRMYNHVALSCLNDEFSILFILIESLKS